MITFSLSNQQRQAWLTTMRQLTRTASDVELEPVLKQITDPGAHYLRAITPRGRNRRNRVALGDSVRTQTGKRGNYTYARVGWIYGRGIRRQQTLAVEHGTRRQRGTTATQRSLEHATGGNLDSVGNVIDRELDRVIRTNQRG